jgi:NitT/TauT family transport system substrate-binding protein
MQTHRNLWLATSVILLTSLILSACGQLGATSQPVKLKMALLPIIDALPMYVAQEQGYFKEQGLEVEFIPVGAAAERDQVIAAGQADGMINDLVSTVLYNKDQPQIEIVSFARVATPESPMYRILASSDSGINSVDGLKGVEIGISEGTVIDYTAHRLLEAEGLTPDEIKTIAVPRMDLRMSLLESGELKAANLPDPLSSLAIQAGAVPILDDTKHPEYGNSVISFRNSVIENNPEAIQGFLAALDKAIQDIKANPTQWQNLLTEQKLVPAPLIGSYEVPPFPSGSIPSEAQWADALAWAKENGLVDKDLPYQGSITADYLP